MNNVMEIVSSPIMWVLAAIPIAIIIIETIVFLKLAHQTAQQPDTNLTIEHCKTAFKTGFISAIGPSTGIFIVMVALIAIIGGPMAWLRISVIGGTGTEMFAATLGAQAAGGDITQGLDLTQMTTAWWAMTTNACGWLIFITIFTSRMDKIRNKIGGKDEKWMGVFSSAASLAIFGALCGQYIIQGITESDYILIVTLIVSAGTMWVCQKIGERYPTLLTYSLGISMVVALTVATVIPA